MSRDESSEKSHILQLFSETVTSILDLRGLNQADLARGIGTDARNVSNWLRRKATPNAVWVVKIADYLDVSLDKLFGRVRPGGDALLHFREDLIRLLQVLDQIVPEESPSQGDRPVATKPARGARSKRKKKRSR